MSSFWFYLIQRIIGQIVKSINLIVTAYLIVPWYVCSCSHETLLFRQIHVSPSRTTISHTGSVPSNLVTGSYHLHQRGWFPPQYWGCEEWTRYVVWVFTTVKQVCYLMSDGFKSPYPVPSLSLCSISPECWMCKMCRGRQRREWCVGMIHLKWW